MQQTEFTDEYGRRMIRRTWRNTRGQLHRTTGPAVEHWTVLPDGAHVLSFQGWYVNGVLHREGRHAYRSWDVARDGSRVLVCEEWARHGSGHRVGGPSYRRWTTGPDGTRTLRSEWYRVNGKSHRVDGPAFDRHVFWWQGRYVREEDLPWLRRGHGLLTAFTGPTQQGGGSGVFPAWSRDTRVVVTGTDSASSTPSTYRSAVGGAVLLCM